MTTSTAVPETDPLETYESVPAISFHEVNGGYAKGAWAKLTVADWPKLLEQKDDDGQIERWDSGDAKLVLVISVTDEQGEKKSLWAKKFGKKAQASIFQQLATAQKKVREEIGDASYRVGPGDTIAIQYVDDDKSVPPKKGNYPKMYKVVIKPGPRPAPNADPFADAPAAAAPAKTEENPFSTPQADAAAAAPARQPGSDPFGPATQDDEPPF